MPEPLDLDAFMNMERDWDYTDIQDLIAELRATRAERDKWKTFRDINLGRAERAEAELAEERQVAEGYASDVTHYQAAIAHAEAERDEQVRLTLRWADNSHDQMARAEQAEAERDGNYNEMMTAYRIAEANLKRAEQAEAAIARVKDALWGRANSSPDSKGWNEAIRHINSALRGDHA